MLPRVDGGRTWTNYGIYSVLNFLLENWRKDSRWSVLSFSSPLLNQLISIPWYVFLSSSILRGTSTPSWSPCPRFEPTPRRKRSINILSNHCINNCVSALGGQALHSRSYQVATIVSVGFYNGWSTRHIPRLFTALFMGLRFCFRLKGVFGRGVELLKTTIVRKNLRKKIDAPISRSVPTSYIVGKV